MTGWLFGLAATASIAAAQGTKSDYDRALSLEAKFAEQVTHDRVEPHWVSPTRFWYAANLGAGRREYWLVDAESGAQQVAFDHAALAGALAEATDRDRDPQRMKIDRIAPEGVDRLALRIDETWWDWDGDQLSQRDGAPVADEVQPMERSANEPSGPGGKPSPRSPDGRWRVEKRLGALVLVDTASGESFVKMAAPLRDGSYDARVAWSPDSTRFVAWENVPGGGRTVQLIESSPADELQPKLHEHQYDKPGDNLPWRRPHLFAVGDADETPLDETLWQNPWSAGDLRWKPDSSAFTFVFNQRGHQVVRLLQADAASGAVQTLIEESSPTFVHYSGEGKCWLYRIDDTDEALWTSERDGWNHLYLVDLTTGAVKRQLTRGPWVVRRVDHVDAEKREVSFRAGGVHADQDPYYEHHCRVSLDDPSVVTLTDGDGSHEAQWSPDGRWLIATYSRVDLAPVTELRRAGDGGLVVELQRGDTAALEAAGWRAPQRFVAKGRDGKTDIYGVVCRPTNFDPAKKYPVVEEHYAGPHASHCPKRFATLHRSQQFADLGFIVVQLDGMGTDHRGKAFHDVCWKNLVDGGFPDRIAWLRALAEHEPAIDLTRVGIRGTSAGGQTAMAALLHHGDFYKAAVSNCGCHDNRTDKVWWNEQWMGWPVGPHYAEQSNVTQAGKLRGDLLLIVGEMDRNVPPTATLQVVDALIKADKDFEFHFVPGAGHGAGGTYTDRRTWDFFVRKLHDVEPRREE
ncbi:Prolyl tripeptidyl peptidase precursor [Botrimarina colliarenosi]|uniref:Prolyl tripeptidyl peptidase n=2 Tax=Botrimarina colliarenosi TaxID=2528001 RepID=A0A5C6ALY5_9BACT|nr:Prolyl tripeptidyl peptidase precursor [Botrimarina colliarenosi]